MATDWTARALERAQSLRSVQLPNGECWLDCKVEQAAEALAALAAEAYAEGQAADHAVCGDNFEAGYAKGHAAGVAKALEVARAKVSEYTPISNQAIGVVNAIKALQASHGPV
jgi:flagellar biosynthesis/type III secretory pathway protein FliH